MSYNPNIPLAGTTLTVSQADIETNFIQANNIFAADHYAFDDAVVADRGLHKKVRLGNIAADPTLVSPETQIYSKTISGAQELFFSNASTVTQLTGFASSSASNGYTRLPSGILLKWGQASVSSGNQSVSFPSGGSIPAFSSIFQVFLQVINAAGSPDNYVYVTSFNTTTINVDSVKRTSVSGAASTFSYLAIGT